MPTLADRILDVAEDAVGIHETPPGSNRGGSEKYQRPYGSWMVGQPWCAAFVGGVWDEAGVPNARAMVSPSTAVMAAYARTHGLVGSPRPGAAFIIPGVHTGLLHSHVGGSVWNTIEGNSGDAVRQRVRNIAGMVIMVPPGLAAEVAPAVPPVLYWFHDTRPETAKAGGFKTRAERAAAIAKLSADWRERVSLWHNAKGFGFTVGPKVVYGPFRTQEARNAARERIAALYHDPVAHYAPFRTELGAGGARVATPKVPGAVARVVGVGKAPQAEALGKTT